MSIRRGNGFTLIEGVVVALLMAVLAVVAIGSYRGFVRSARVDSARSACELIGAAIIQTHNRGLDVAQNDWDDIGISNSSDDFWTYTFPALSASSAVGTDYAVSATSSKLGTWLFKPRQTGGARWGEQ